ncbi:MAG: cytochrome c3 family protein [Desulfuromusa sp.]|nr:cytochrome c3 family protein [Desulfuromusa sp.]
MLKFKANAFCQRMVSSIFCVLLCIFTVPAQGGTYLDSAHGNATYGVNRSSLDGRYVNFATGNCAHCHETHASLEGSEPVPSAGPASHTLFAEGFNLDRTLSPYLESDNFCFYCHSDVSGQQVINSDYSSAFGGGALGAGPQSIMAAFNQTSYHNLLDIRTFLSSDPAYATWFANRGNPCSGCHNSHLAKRNWDSGEVGFPLRSAISKPAANDSLWGEGEVMSAYSSYEAPYSSSPAREPAGFGDADGTKTPDYIGFCASCHNALTILPSTTLGRNVKFINWQSSGLSQDKHGELSRDGTDNFREPYATAATLKSNFVLSCLDCHESHGSSNILMLRVRINGEDLEGTIDSTDSMSFVCKRCHPDDQAAEAGTSQADSWEFVHHLATGAPYPQMACGTCHIMGGGGTVSEPIACGNCHGHGMDDSVLGANQTGLRTF